MMPEVTDRSQQRMGKRIQPVPSLHFQAVCTLSGKTVHLQALLT